MLEHLEKNVCLCFVGLSVAELLRRAASYLRDPLPEYLEDSANELDAAAQQDPPDYRAIVVRALWPDRRCAFRTQCVVSAVPENMIVLCPESMAVVLLASQSSAVPGPNAVVLGLSCCFFSKSLEWALPSHACSLRYCFAGAPLLTI